MFASIVLFILQAMGFAFFCGVGASTATRLAAYSRWLPLWVACLIVLAMVEFVAVFNQQLVGVPIILVFCLIGFAAGILNSINKR